ncbi:MAG: hypothetical protein QRY71_01845 [Candidatus Rhabdochlamydia sp.]
MNLLPFVMVFLLMLSLGTTMMLDSTLHFFKLHQTYFSQHTSYHTLLSQQNQLLFEEYDKKHQTLLKPSEITLSPLKKQKTTCTSKITTLRNIHRELKTGCEGSKLNLWDMIHGENKELQNALETIFIHMLEALYATYPFYQVPYYPSLAKTVAQEMITQKITTFEELTFQDPLLDHLYYKMIQGTSSSYPSLKEYCLLENGKREPIYFRFASKTLLQAALGSSLASRIFLLEEKLYQEHFPRKVLKKELFMQEALYHLPSWITPSLLLKLLNFQNKQKGLPQFSLESPQKIRAYHTVKKTESL